MLGQHSRRPSSGPNGLVQAGQCPGSMATVAAPASTNARRSARAPDPDPPVTRTRSAKRSARRPDRPQPRRCSRSASLRPGGIPPPGRCRPQPELAQAEAGPSTARPPARTYINAHRSERLVGHEIWRGRRIDARFVSSKQVRQVGAQQTEVFLTWDELLVPRVRGLRPQPP